MSKRHKKIRIPIPIKKKGASHLFWVRVFGHCIIAALIYLLPYLVARLSIERAVYYYFFSTVSQSLAGIFAVIGTYLTFRINSINNLMEHVEYEILSIINDPKYSRIKVYTRTNIPLIHQNYMDLLTDQGDQIKFVILMNEYRSLEGSKSLIFKRALFPLIYNAIVILLSISLMPFTDWFTESHLLGKGVLTGVIFFCCWTIGECLNYLFPFKPEETIEII